MRPNTGNCQRLCAKEKGIPGNIEQKGQVKYKIKIEFGRLSRLSFYIQKYTYFLIIQLKLGQHYAIEILCADTKMFSKNKLQSKMVPKEKP